MSILSTKKKKEWDKIDFNAKIVKPDNFSG
jgi:hypothetical protein